MARVYASPGSSTPQWLLSGPAPALSAMNESEAPGPEEIAPGEIVITEDGKEMIMSSKGELVEQEMFTPAHGHGQLKRGNYGNKGGGRKTDEARRFFLELLKAGQEEAHRRMSPENVGDMTDQDLAKFLDVFGKYSVGTKQTLTGPDDGPLQHGIMALPPLDTNGEAEGDDS